MLNLSQRAAVFVAVKKSYTISSKSFTAKCLWPNEAMTTFPAIVLNLIDEENKYQNAIGNFIGTDGSLGQRSLATLSINVYAKDAQNLNGHDIAREVMRQLSLDIRENWLSLSGGTIKFRRMSSIRNLTDLVPEGEKLTTGRFQVDCYLSYDISW